jgi:hypothetical protein
MAWVGAEGAGSTVAPSRSMATGFGRRRTVILTVIMICSISSARCSTNCPQEFQIQIFENFHFG